MAEIIGKAGKWIGQAADHVNSRAIDEGGISEGSLHDYTQGPINKMWRLIIINQRARMEYPKDLNRATGKVNDALNLHYARQGSLSESQKLDPWKIRNQYRTKPLPDTSLPTVDSTNVKLEIYKSFRGWIRSQRDKCAASSKHNQIIIVNTNTSPATSIILQNRPPTIQVNNQSYWVSVKSMGRNNPFMMYTGGEDSIQLEVSWFVTDENNRKEVLTKCRLLESWSRADGYAASPPTLKISWGSADIFKDDQFILESASYQLSNFQSYSREYYVKNGAYVLNKSLDIGLAPQCATQTLIFKRVTNFNRTHLDIIPFEELEKVADIKIENNQA